MTGTRSSGGFAEGVGLWLVLATAIVSGVSTFVNSYAVVGTSSAAFVTVRNVLVALMIAPFALLVARSANDRPTPSDWGRLLLIGLIGGAIPFLLFFQGLKLATEAGGATTASFLYRTLFLWAMLLGVLVLGERLRWRVALAAGALLVGNFLLLAMTSVLWTDGSFYVLVATALWAGEYLVSKRTMQDLSSGTVALARMGFGAIFLLGYLGLTGGFATVAAFHASDWLWIGISAALLAAFVGTWYPGLKRVDLGTATAVLVLGFPITVLIATLVKGTPTPELPAIGAVLVGLGVFLAIGSSQLRNALRVLRTLVARAPIAP